MDLELDHPVVLAHVGRIGTIGVVRLEGHLTRGTAAALRTQLIDALGTAGPRLVVSMRGVRACDGAGLRAVEAATSRARRRGGWLRLVEVSDAVAAAYAEHGGCPDLYTGLEDAVHLH